MGARNFIAGMILGVFIALGINSFADPSASFEMLLGQTKFKAREDGTWWQSGPSSETHNNLISSSYLLGMKWSAGNYGIRYGYTRLGEYSGTNWASVLDEDANNALTVATCNPDTAKDCPALYKGQGKAQGVYFGPFVEKAWGNLSVLGELGLFLFRSTYDVTVYHPYDHLYGPKAQSFEHNRATGSHATWYWGAQVSYKIFRDASAVLMYREYWSIWEQGMGPGGDVGLTCGRTRQILSGLSVTF